MEFKTWVPCYQPISDLFPCLLPKFHPGPCSTKPPENPERCKAMAIIDADEFPVRCTLIKDHTRKEHCFISRGPVPKDQFGRVLTRPKVFVIDLPA